jgi:hypothetical protein
MTRRRVTSVALALALLAVGCATDEDGAEGEAGAEIVSLPAPAPPPSAPEPQPEPEPEPRYEPPDDWAERGLASAGTAREAVVAVGWRPAPPAMVVRRIETGWLITPDLVVTSNVVACDAQAGSELRVRTIRGTIRQASVLEVIGGCEQWEGGIGLLRLDRPVDAPTLTLREEPVEIGEPLLAIGHANMAATLGGWFVLAGPMVETTGRLLWADIVAPVRYQRTDEFFGGGSDGALVIDIDGRVVTVLCCERDWGPQLHINNSPVADPLLRSALTIDEPYFVGGLTTSELRRALEPYVELD